MVYIYNSLILISLLFAWYSYKAGSKKSLYLIILLFATFVDEGIAAYSYYHHKNLDWDYHIFNPIEYTLFCLYYNAACEQKVIKRFVIYSIPAFVLFAILISTFYYHFKSMPGLNINIEGLIQFILYTHLLFCINVHNKMFVHNHPDFWICIGVMIYFGGVFTLFGLYSKIANLNQRETLHLFIKISLPLNLVLYSCFIIGLACSLRYRKYLAL